MFLECIKHILHILQCLLIFIEEHIETIGVIGALVGSIFWVRRFIRQKRAEAFFGFYTKLTLCINELVTTLQDDDQLETDDPKKGNIFSMLYSDECLKTTCPQYHKPAEKQAVYINHAEEVWALLHNTDQNVYPKGSKRSTWYEQMFVIYSFCDFLRNEKNWHTTTEPTKNDEYKHIKKCKEFLFAVNYIKEAIEKTKY